MLTRKLLMSLAAATLAALLIAGVTQLFFLRFEAGDVYPPYSSLRSDPLGTRALFEAIEAMDGFHAERLFRPLKRIESGAGQTLMILGLDGMRFVNPDDMRQLEVFAAAGNRVVISMLPQNAKVPAASTPSEKDEKERKAANQDEETEDAGRDRRLWSILAEHLGFKPAMLPLGKELKATPRAAQLDPVVTWHSGVAFSHLAEGWHAAYTIGPRPVVIERRYGNGSFVLSSDSYLFSNEALRDERHPRLLAWILGGNDRVMFDETHHGVAENPGLMGLMRKYHLQPLLGVFGLLGVLFVWRNAVPLLPGRAAGGDPGEVKGLDASRARVNLLRRSIAPGDLIAICAEQWKQTCGHRVGHAAAPIDSILAAEGAKPPRERQPVDAYRRIARIVNEHQAQRIGRPSSPRSS